MTTDRRRRVSVVLVAGLVVCAAFAGVALLPSVNAQNTSVMNGERATAAFNQSNVTERRGDIAAIELNLTKTRNATLTVGSESVNYETNVTVNDTNGDGRVTVLMNTYIAGTSDNESTVYGATGTDTVTRTNRTTGPLASPLETSTYNLSVMVGSRETDTATLALRPRTTGDLVTWTAPAASFDNTTNASAVTAAIENGRITTTDTIANGDVLVNQFKLTGIYGALAASNFTHLVRTGALDYSLVQTNPDTNRPPKRLDLNRSLANGSIHVVPDERNNVLYVDVDTGAATFENGTPTAGDEFESRLTVNGNSSLAGSNRSMSANVTLVGTELGLGEVTLAADANQTVTGTTSTAPGSDVTVRLQRNGTGSFLKTNTTTVNSNGTFTAGFNLSDVAPRTPITVEADGPLDTADQTNTTIRPSRSNESGNGTARLVFTDQQTTGETVKIKNVTLPAGGFAVVPAKNVSSAPVESVLGASSYLKNGTTRNVTVTLDHPLDASTRLVVMAHRDTNGNQVYDFGSSNGTEDGPYTARGSPVAATAQVTVRNTTTGAASASETANATPQTGTAGENTTRGTGGTTNGGGPGFGVSVAVLALLLAGLAAWRER